MAVGNTRSVALTGVTGTVVDVEAFTADGLPKFKIVGLPDASLNEARDRVLAACATSGLSIAADMLTVNLSPGWIPKTGTGFDLAMAMAILGAKGVLSEAIASAVFLGELGLDGYVRTVRGILPAVAAARDAGCDRVFVPESAHAEAELVRDVDVQPVTHLRHLIERFAASDTSLNDVEIPEREADPDPAVVTTRHATVPDMADVHGQPTARLGMEVAAAGGHHALLLGAPGSGKTMLARRLPGILPTLDDRAAVEVTAVHSVAGAATKVTELIRRPPFEDPHHTATTVAIIGGGSPQIQPGAASRAHHGVLFLDEAPEFTNHVLQALRQPLESGEIAVARAKMTARFPARFQLLLAANPCPCGYALDPTGTCECPSRAKQRYLGKLSGPLLDRIDVRMAVPAVTRAQMTTAASGEPSAVIAARVAAARAAQAERWAAHPWALNVAAPGEHLRTALRLPEPDRRCLDMAMDRGILTARGYDRALRVAWTLADLAGATRPTADHVGLALTLRGMEITA